MKIYFFFNFFLVLLSVCNAQEITTELDSSKALSVYELKEAQWKEWAKIEEEWKKEYSKILKEQKIKMSCSGCESVYMEVVLCIDEDGKLKYYRLVKTKKCGAEFSKGLEIRFMKWFFTKQFPAELYNTRFQVRLGTGLKC